MTNPNTPFSIVGGSCLAVPLTLMSTETCTFIVEFNAGAQGDYMGSFYITSNTASSPTTVNLAGSVAIRIIPALNTFGLLVLMFYLLAFVSRSLSENSSFTPST